MLRVLHTYKDSTHEAAMLPGSGVIVLHGRLRIALVPRSLGRSQLEWERRWRQQMHVLYTVGKGECSAVVYYVLRMLYCVGAC